MFASDRIENIKDIVVRAKNKILLGVSNAKAKYF